MTSTPTSRKLAIALTGATLALGTAVPVAGGQTQDLRSPDARDAAQQAVHSVPQDLRSPDTRDAAQQAVQSAPQDLRSPDTRDVASGYEPVLDTRQVSGASPSSGDGFDWASAAIGVAAVGGVVLMFVAFGIYRRGHPHGAVRV